jgi:hypothetical protein
VAQTTEICDAALQRRREGKKWIDEISSALTNHSFLRIKFVILNNKASAEVVFILEDEEKEEIYFSNLSSSYCVCFVSIVDSIGFIFQINDADKIRKYYSIFINTMAAIARNFGAKIIKNTGTSLVYFFPKTSSTGDNESALRCFGVWHYNDSSQRCYK